MSVLIRLMLRRSQILLITLLGCILYPYDWCNSKKFHHHPHDAMLFKLSLHLIIPIKRTWGEKKKKRKEKKPSSNPWLPLGLNRSSEAREQPLRLPSLAPPRRSAGPFPKFPSAWASHNMWPVCTSSSMGKNLHVSAPSARTSGSEGKKKEKDTKNAFCRVGNG